MIVVACDSPRPTPSPSPASTTTVVETHSPTGGPSASVIPSPRPLPLATDEAPTAIDLINVARQAGRIDAATELLYRFYAQWGDARLPEEYRGVWVEDRAVALAAEATIDALSPEQQAELRPFLVRPTDPTSYWSSDAVGATASVITVDAVIAAATPPCTGGWARLDVATIPVSIWGRCRDGAGGALTVPLSGPMAQVEQFIADLWPDMTRLMGLPIEDRFKSGTTQGAGEPPEAGDGRVDIYIVEAPRVSYLRNVTNTSLAVARVASPFKNGTSSGYLVVDPTKARSAAIFKTNVAHEFFHILQGIYNGTATFHCPYPNPAGPCPGVARQDHWFSEASATWAEHHFVPEARETEIYDRRYPRFVSTTQSLSDGSGTNPYNSFIWPLFMEQEAITHEDVIAEVWKSFFGRDTWASLQSAVDVQLPFEDHFGDFAVRVWNEKLEPGDPIQPRFQKLDPGFPPLQPFQGDPAPRFREPVIRVDPYVMPVQSFTEDLAELWASYYDITPDPLAKRITFSFAGLQPNANLSVDALVRVKGVGWERRTFDPTVTEICLDRPADAFEQVILVLSNHSKDPNDHVRGSWSVHVDAAGCATVSDGLVYTSFREVGQAGDDFYQTVHESLTLRLNLKPPPPDSNYAAGFVNNGSTHRAGIETTGFIAGIPGANCDTVSEGQGGSGGTLAGIDSVVASLAYEPAAPNPNASVEPVGQWAMVVATAIPVEVTIAETSCAGSASRTETVILQLPDCKGFELVDTDPARIFNFNCSSQLPGWSWSITGKVRLQT